MDKMFLTIPQAAKRIGCTERQILQWFADGRLQEFKDLDVSMAKTEQIDLIAKEWKREQLFPDGKSLLELSLDNETSSREDTFHPDRLPAMTIGKKGSPFPLIIFGFVIIALVGLILIGIFITELKKKEGSKIVPRVVENIPTTVSPSVKYKISILLGDKVYKTITVSKRVEFVNGGVRWIEDNGHMGYCSGQFFIETIDGN